MKRFLTLLLVLALLCTAGCQVLPQTESAETKPSETKTLVPTKTKEKTETENKTEEIVLPLQDTSAIDPEKKVAVFVLFGQSNAGGYGLDLAESEKINTPLKNVFGLNRDHFQLSKPLNWSGYVSRGMNLANYEDDTASVATNLAKKWQAAIDGGANLPDLYIVHIALGGQGITQDFKWHPTSGELYKKAESCFKNLQKSFADQNKEAEFIGLHWIGGEGDTKMPYGYLAKNLKPLYIKLFNDLYSHLGFSIPTTLYHINCADYWGKDSEAEYNRTLTNKLFDQLADETEYFQTFNTQNFPGYTPDVPGDGLYGDDKLHYTRDVTNWIADEILKNYQNK